MSTSGRVEEGAMRLSSVLMKVGADKMVPGVRQLWELYTEERARRFMGWLATGSTDEQNKAEEIIGKLAGSREGMRIIRHICRDVLFGTETISTAALAIVAGEAANAPDDPILGRAARALEGLSDNDAIGFLALLHRIGDFYVQLGPVLPEFYFDVDRLVGRLYWQNIESVFGLGPYQIYSTIDECINRRLFLADASVGRGGSPNDKLPRVFLLHPETARYFRIIGRAVEFASSDSWHSLQPPLDFSCVDAACQPRPSASEDQSKTSVKPKMPGGGNQ